MDVVVIGRQAIFKLKLTVFALTQGWAVDQKVVVAGVFLFGARRRHAHPPQAEHNGDRIAKRVTVTDVHKVYFCVRVRRRLTSGVDRSCQNRSQQSGGNDLFHIILPFG